MIRRRLFIASLLATLLLTACHRRPLTDPEDAALLNVHLVTEGINNVTCNIYNPAIEAPVITSEAVRSLIYDPSGQPILSQGMLTTTRSTNAATRRWVPPSNSRRANTAC